MLKPNLAGDVGPTPGRKIKSFLWLVAAISFFTWLTTKIQTPEQIAVQGLYMIGAGGLFAIGGQALVDAFGKYTDSKRGLPREEVSTVATTTSKKVKQ